MAKHGAAASSRPFSCSSRRSARGAAGAQTVGEQIRDVSGRDHDRSATGRCRSRSRSPTTSATSPATASSAISSCASRTTRSTTGSTTSTSRASPPIPARRAQLKTTRKGAFLELRVGDPNHTITGVHHYQIAYTVRGAHADVPRPRRAVLGRDRQPVARSDRQRARHHRRARLDHARRRASRARREARFRATARRRSEAEAMFKQQSLAENSGLTAVVALPKGTIQPPPAPILEKRKTLANVFEVTPRHDRAWAARSRSSAS